MKFRLYAVNFLAILLCCIIGANVFYTLFLPARVHGETMPNPSLPNTQEPDVILPEEEEEAPLSVIKFVSFKQAYTHAYRFLHSSKGYSSVSRGSFSARAAFIEVRQTMYIHKQVNKANNQSYVLSNSKKATTFGADTALEYYQNAGDVAYRQGWRSGDGFAYPNNYVGTTMEEYLKTFTLSPIHLIVSLNETMPTMNGRIQNDGAEYILTFEMPFASVAEGLIMFLLKQLNAPPTLKFELQEGIMKFDLRLSYYGVIKSVKYYADYEIYFPSLPEIGLPIMASGTFSMTETFSNVNKNIKITNFTEGLEPVA